MDWIAQITDLHAGEIKAVGDQRVDTATGARRAVAHLNALSPRPLAVLITGDLVARETPAHYEALAEILRELAMPFYVIPGNHDDRAMIRAALGGLTDLSGQDEFLQRTIEDLPLRVVLLDSHQAGEVGGRLCAARLAWLDETLAVAPERPTLLAVHHPPFDTGIEFFDTIGLHDADALATVVARHRQVKAITCGHVHRPIAALWAGCLVVVTPSSGYQYGLTLQSGVMIAPVVEPPACRLFGWGGARGLVTHLSYIPQ